MVLPGFTAFAAERKDGHSFAYGDIPKWSVQSYVNVNVNVRLHDKVTYNNVYMNFEMMAGEYDNLRLPCPPCEECDPNTCKQVCYRFNPSTETCTHYMQACPCPPPQPPPIVCGRCYCGRFGVTGRCECIQYCKRGVHTFERPCATPSGCPGGCIGRCNGDI